MSLSKLKKATSDNSSRGVSAPLSLVSKSRVSSSSTNKENDNDDNVSVTSSTSRVSSSTAASDTKKRRLSGRKSVAAADMDMDMPVNDDNAEKKSVRAPRVVPSVAASSSSNPKAPLVAIRTKALAARRQSLSPPRYCYVVAMHHPIHGHQ